MYMTPFVSGLRDVTGFPCQQPANSRMRSRVHVRRPPVGGPVCSAAGSCLRHLQGARSNVFWGVVLCFFPLFSLSLLVFFSLLVIIIFFSLFLFRYFCLCCFVIYFETFLFMVCIIVIAINIKLLLLAIVKYYIKYYIKYSPFFSFSSGIFFLCCLFNLFWDFFIHGIHFCCYY